MARAQRRVNRVQPAAVSVPFPAPVGGLNKRDNRSSLDPTEARELLNWLPDQGTLRVRDGYTQFATSIGSGVVPTLMRYRGAAAQKLIAIAGGTIYDVSSSTPSTISAAGYTSDHWQLENFNGFLIGVNGVDTPFRYDGSTVSATGFTGSGLTLTNLVNVALVRNRLWFCENASADVWYGGLGSITGTLTKFQLSQIAQGGKCMAIMPWSRDSGAGADDVTVFLMDTGEVIVYEGDPASTFSKIGSYRAGVPVGRQCWVKYGGDLVLITRIGFLPMHTILSGLPEDVNQIDIWGKVAPGVVDDVRLYGANVGWSARFVDKLILFNVPVGNGASVQYVLNTTNNRWTQFDYPAASFEEYNGEIYFGSMSGGTTQQVGGATDNGIAITATARGGFGYPLSQSANKHITAIRPNITADGIVDGYLEVDVDFESTDFGTTSFEIVSAGNITPWGSPWGSPWGTKPKAPKIWFAKHARGRAIALALRVSTKAANVQWDSSDMLQKPVGIL